VERGEYWTKGEEEEEEQLSLKRAKDKSEMGRDSKEIVRRVPPELRMVVGRIEYDIEFMSKGENRSSPEQFGIVIGTSSNVAKNGNWTITSEDSAWIIGEGSDPKYALDDDISLDP